MSETNTIDKTWLSLKEAAELKGINYNTLLNKKELQPNCGFADARIGGRRKWSRETITDWLKMTDDELERDYLDYVGSERYGT